MPTTCGEGTSSPSWTTSVHEHAGGFVHPSFEAGWAGGGGVVQDLISPSC